MKNPAIILFFLLLNASVFAQNEAVTKEILAVQQVRFNAMTGKDTLALRDLLTDDMMYIHSNAMVESKSQHLEAIISGKVIYEKMVPEATKVRHYGKIAIANGKVNVKGQLNGNTFEIVLLYTAVYRKDKGNWKLASWQSARVP
jgi:ketosteroid isomerase-like protein